MRKIGWIKLLCMGINNSYFYNKNAIHNKSYVVIVDCIAYNKL